MNACNLILLITIIVVNLIDLSGFIQEMESLIARHYKVSRDRVHIPKPFSCSYCMTHHIGLIVLICIGCLNLYTYAFLLLCSFLTPVIGSLFQTLKNGLELIPKGLDVLFLNINNLLNRLR